MLKIFTASTCTLLLHLIKSKKPLWLFMVPSLFLLAAASLLLTYSPLLTPKTSTLFFLDTISTPLISLSLWITALMLLASMKILHSSAAPTSFSVWVTLLLTSLLLSFSQNNLLLFYITFESTLIPTLLLILGWGYQPERLQAGLYFMLYTVLASLPLLLSIFLLTNLSHTSFLSPWPSPCPTPNLSSLFWLSFNTAFLVKLPLFLTHLWLPKAHVEAPVAGSMILAAILLKLGGYGLLRSALLLPFSPPLPCLTLSIALWGATTTSLICLRQTDLKALIAYSSVGHMGLLIAGIMTLTPLGILGSATMMIAHGLASSGLFALANITYESTNTRSIFITKGLASLFPQITLWWFLLLSANMAAPPSINLLSEIFLLSSILSWAPLTLILLASSSFLSAAYSLYLYTATQHGQPPKFLNPLNLLSPTHLTLCLLHLLPVAILTLKIEILNPII